MTDTLYYNLNTIIGKLYKSKISLNEAINNDLVVSPHINLIALTLNNTKRTETFNIKRGNYFSVKPINCTYNEYKKFIYNKILYANLNLIVSCTQKEKYDS